MLEESESEERMKFDRSGRERGSVRREEEATQALIKEGKQVLLSELPEGTRGAYTLTF